jgi:hypothetical protein
MAGGPIQTSAVNANLTMGVSDLQSGAQIVSHVLSPVVFQGLSVQYQGYLNIPTGSTFNFTLYTATPFAVVFIRNFGGQGSGNVAVVGTPTLGASSVLANLEIGGVFLYICPKLSAVIVDTVQSGFTAISLICAPTTSGNVEALLAS